MSNLLTPKQAAERLSVTVSALATWRARPERGGPPYVRLTERVVRYEASALDRWIEGRRVG